MSRIPRLAGVAASLAAIALVWGLVTLVTPPGRPVSGHALAIDGDTLRIGDAHIRLMGLDAPEIDQTCTRPDGTDWTCGREARAFLSRFVRDDDATCATSGRDRYRRLLARCTVGADDIGEALVAAGWAVPADVQYGDAAQAARSARRGIWAGSFVEPAEWRRAHGEAGLSLWDWLRSWFG